MKICQRCPFPKSLSSGKGLAIASLKVISTLYHISNLFISWAYGHMKICQRCPFLKYLTCKYSEKFSTFVGEESK